MIHAHARTIILIMTQECTSVCLSPPLIFHQIKIFYKYNFETIGGGATAPLAYAPTLWHKAECKRLSNEPINTHTSHACMVI